MPSVSKWLITCQTDMDCDQSEACATWMGAGWCAPLPNPECTFGVPTKLPSFGGQGDVEVCASPDPRCDGGLCGPGCGDSSGVMCGNMNGDTCSKATGKCECKVGTECSTGVCGTNKLCAQCAKDEDCGDLAAFGQDKCINGACGCSAADVCLDLGYANATIVCQ
jgi:hypothetical protein